MKARTQAMTARVAMYLARIARRRIVPSARLTPTVLTDQQPYRAWHRILLKRLTDHVREEIEPSS